MTIILISILGLLALIGFQDFRDRSFLSLFIPALVILSIIYNYLLKGDGLTYSDWVLNFTYIGITLIALQGYYFLKTRRLVFITKEAFAWGDVLLLFIAALLMPLKILIIVLLLASLIGLLYYYKSNKTNKRRGIPFAGILSLLLIPILIFKIWM